MQVPKQLMYIIFALALLGLVILLKIIIFRIHPFLDQYLLMKEQDLKSRYSSKDGTWVLITGPSSGMGERFAHEFADRGFNLLLVGSKRTKAVIRDIKKTHKNIQIKFIEIDFSNSFNTNFFDPIQK